MLQNLKKEVAEELKMVLTYVVQGRNVVFPRSTPDAAMVKQVLYHH